MLRERVTYPMVVDQTQLARLVTELTEVKLVSLYRDAASVRLLLGFLSDFYQQCPPETVASPLRAFVSPTTPEALRSLAYLTQEDGPLADVRCPTIVQVTGPGAFRVWRNVDVQLSTTVEESILLYCLDDREFFEVRGTEVLVPGPYRYSRSWFARPSFSSLEEALNHYAIHNALNAVDPILPRCWVDQFRLRWKAAPEAKLRDSLWHFLRTSLRGCADPKREQNVDATHPVDIKVTWFFAKAISLIEVKWLGCSFNDKAECTANYGAGRAIDGALQLRDYLDLMSSESPDIWFAGYLTVFDGRREKVSDFWTEPTPEEALAFEHREIAYPAELASDRRLRLGPRFFVRPDLRATA